jgi:hypothetical protein
MRDETKLKGKAKRRSGPYPLGEIPASVALAIGRKIAHRVAVGNANIDGNDFGGIFASAIGGMHRNKPLGIADVLLNGCAWSVKTVQSRAPFKQKRVRVISGRNSPIYSLGISDPYADIRATGRAVLKVWNARVDEAFKQFEDLRILIMVRSMARLHFTLFEKEAIRFVPADYRWERNKKGNLEGYDARTNEHFFTWQPSGSQFTIFHHVPASAYNFRFTKRPGLVEESVILDLIKFEDSWIEEVKESDE